MASSRFTLQGCLYGARLTLPLMPGLVVFASAFGTAAQQRGLSFEQALAMSAFVYAGASQMVALEVWQAAWTPGTILGIAAVTGVVNSRMVLAGASIQPWLRDEPPGRLAANLFFLTDANWLLATRYREEGGRDVGVLFGAGIALWVLWVLSTVPGYLAGALVSEPRRFGLDLVMPIFFSAMLVPLWRGRRAAWPWAVAGAVALAVQALVPGYAFIVAGALAGAVAGAFQE
ncbi:MAG TPA: AzlC family ABC transporter permease [Microvirga sp.]|jgi:predicted branched-subunit amino acid permease|nr:AzlC family ABC transporter permease [Microvirga sp.]